MARGGRQARCGPTEWFGEFVSSLSPFCDYFSLSFFENSLRFVLYFVPDLWSIIGWTELCKKMTVKFLVIVWDMLQIIFLRYNTMSLWILCANWNFCVVIYDRKFNFKGLIWAATGICCKSNYCLVKGKQWTWCQLQIRMQFMLFALLLRRNSPFN
jgi:hypothetical protein